MTRATPNVGPTHLLLIEEKLAAFDERFPRSGYLYAGFVEATAEMNTFLRDALEEMLLVGLELAEGVVPEGEIEGIEKAVGAKQGAALSREQTLSRLAALKKEVMEGRKDS